MTQIFAILICWQAGGAGYCKVMPSTPTFNDLESCKKRLASERALLTRDSGDYYKVSCATKDVPTWRPAE